VKSFTLGGTTGTPPLVERKGENINSEIKEKGTTREEMLIWEGGDVLPTERKKGQYLGGGGKELFAFRVWWKIFWKGGKRTKLKGKTFTCWEEICWRARGCLLSG